MPFSIHTDRSKEIFPRFVDFYRTKNIQQLFAAIALIIRQRRFQEFAYGILCFLFSKPSRPVEIVDFQANEGIALAREQFIEKKKENEKIILETLHLGCDDETDLGDTIHGYAMTADGFIFGEYAAHSSRIFLKEHEEFSVCHFYQNDPGVRHIHSILRSGETIFISTGDSNKYLDRWRLRNGHLEFEKRIFHTLGGFTTCCNVNEKHFFGTDFSERPNYIFCLESQEKWFFPRPAYTQHCSLMLLLHDRYLFCLNTGLSHRQTISIFDTRTSVFIHCQEYRGNDFLGYPENWRKLPSSSRQGQPLPM
jgi:hypothetical protein